MRVNIVGLAETAGAKSIESSNDEVERRAIPATPSYGTLLTLTRPPRLKGGARATTPTDC
jgi:hypothetical protein